MKKFRKHFRYTALFGMVFICVNAPQSVSAQDEVPVNSMAPAPQSPPEQVVQPIADIAIPAIPASPAQSTAEAPPVAGLTPSITPLPDASAGQTQGTNVMGDSGAPQAHSGTYYDADALVPNRDMQAAGATGPRKVDPALEPGQRYIVVEKAGSASSFEGRYIAANRALKLGRYAAAMEMFEELYGKNHKDPRILMGLAVSQQGAGFNESAARTYEDLLRVQPNNPDAIINLMGLMREQYPEVTLRKLMELRNKYPSNPGIPAQMGLINAQLKNYPDAIRYMEVAASMEPRNSSHVYNMAIVTDRAGKVEKAIELYERALQMDASYGSNSNTIPREEIYDRLVVLRRKV